MAESDKTKQTVMMITPGRASECDLFGYASSLIARIKERPEVTLLQVREKSLSAREVFDLSKMLVDAGVAQVLVNERFDIAIACGAAGVHLTSGAMPAEIVRAKVPNGFLIGRSTHSAEEVQQAADAGCDYSVFGPVYETASKTKYGAPFGLEGLRRVTGLAKGFPVLAIGGIVESRVAELLEAGAAGYAAIGMFDE